MDFQPDEIRVLKILADAKAMPFLDLQGRSGLHENVLQSILERLEQLGVVRVTNAEDVFEEIVTVRDRGLRLAYGT